MTAQLITPAYFQRLKRRAKAMTRISGAPLHATLNELAVRHGYPNWSVLAKHVQSA